MSIMTLRVLIRIFTVLHSQTAGTNFVACQLVALQQSKHPEGYTNELFEVNLFRDRKNAVVLMMY